jgi:hypothetical protein
MCECVGYLRTHSQLQLLRRLEPLCELSEILLYALVLRDEGEGSFLRQTTQLRGVVRINIPVCSNIRGNEVRLDEMR